MGMMMGNNLVQLVPVQLPNGQVRPRLACRRAGTGILQRAGRSRARVRRRS